MGLLNRIIVEDVLLEDRRGREMLKVARLSAKFEILPLLKGKITITSVQLFGFSANMERETPQSPPNYQFVLDAFASKDTVKTQTNLDLRINSLLIRRGRITYDVLSEPETPRTVQYRPSCRKELRSHRFAEGAPQRLAERLHPSSEL